MILKKIVLGVDEESKREAVQENLGQHVILEDETQEVGHAELLTDPEPDNQCYYARFGDARGNTMLWYHDLQQLMIIANDPRFPRPELAAQEEQPPSQPRSKISSIFPILIGGSIGLGLLGIYYIPQAIRYLSKQ